jgi:hypothetical protein
VAPAYRENRCGGRKVTLIAFKNFAGFHGIVSKVHGELLACATLKMKGRNNPIIDA